MLIIGAFGLFIVGKTKKNNQEDMNSFDKLNFYGGIVASVFAIILGFMTIFKMFSD